MRGEPHSALLANEGVSVLRLEGEHASAFLGQGPSLNAVEMQNACVGG
jgi:hypothetical protein